MGKCFPSGVGWIVFWTNMIPCGKSIKMSHLERTKRASQRNYELKIVKETLTYHQTILV